MRRLPKWPWYDRDGVPGSCVRWFVCGDRVFVTNGHIILHVARIPTGKHWKALSPRSLCRSGWWHAIRRPWHLPSVRPSAPRLFVDRFLRDVIARRVVTEWLDYRYVGLVERAFPGASWSLVGKGQPVAAVRGETVEALVMPMILKGPGTRLPAARRVA